MKFLSFVRRSLARPASDFVPKAAILAPCKGLEHGLSESLDALFTQDYPDYEIFFAVASKRDPVVPVIEDLIGRYPHRKSRLVVAGPASGRSEKINNLLHAIDHLDPATKAIIFVDSDASVQTGWLRSLVAPLADSSVGASTGYRWYLPVREGFWAAVLSAWNGSIATTLGDHRRNFAWGGSTAILRDTLDRINIRAAWDGAASDDYALTRAVERAGLRIDFVPRCLVISRESARLGGLLEFTTRQIIITRVYRPESWWLGIITYTLFVLLFFGGVAATVASAFTGSFMRRAGASSCGHIHSRLAQRRVAAFSRARIHTACERRDNPALVDVLSALAAGFARLLLQLLEIRDHPAHSLARRQLRASLPDRNGRPARIKDCDRGREGSRIAPFKRWPSQGNHKGETWATRNRLIRCEHLRAYAYLTCRACFRGRSPR